MTVRFKIAALVAVVVATVTGLDGWLVPERAAEAEHDALKQRAEAVAAILGSSARGAVEFDQADSARDALEVSEADDLIVWSAVYRPDGTRMAAVGPGSPRRIRLDGESRLRDDDGRIEAMAPIGETPEELGVVVVALDSRMVAGRRETTRQVIAVQGLVVFALGILLAFLLSSRMATSIIQMAEAAEQVARGEVGGDLKLTDSQDELGDMARSFRHMHERLRELQQVSIQVAGGDLTASIDGDGALYSAFRQMVENLNDLTARVRDSSEAVSSAAARMFSATREQEALGTQQTASLEEIRRTLESLADASQGVNADAQSVREMSLRTLESSQRVTEQTRLVSAHSERIGEILSLIQDIADRSDLLALNAALEGTRAGDVGKGFSLVAAEMRRLSEHVMDSVRDIRKLVADMRAASHSSVLATEESTKLAKEAAAAASKISEMVSRQQEGTVQAKSAADEIVRAVNESFAGSAQTTASAEALLQLSHELKNTLRTFRTASDEE